MEGIHSQLHSRALYCSAGLPAADTPRKISGVHKRCWRYIPNKVKAEESTPKAEVQAAWYYLLSRLLIVKHGSLPSLEIAFLSFPSHLISGWRLMPLLIGKHFNRCCSLQSCASVRVMILYSVNKLKRAERDVVQVFLAWWSKLCYLL